MPNVGTTASGKSLGKSPGSYILAACKDCGLERWVRKSTYTRDLLRLCRNCASRRASALGKHTKYLKGINVLEAGRTVEKRGGYIFIRLSPDDLFHCMIKGGPGRHYIAEHRYVMAKHLGRPLGADEIVHHLNGNKGDNRIENLRLMTNADHRTMADASLQQRIKLLEWHVKNLNAEVRELRQSLQLKFKEEIR